MIDYSLAYLFEVVANDSSVEGRFPNRPGVVAADVVVESGRKIIVKDGYCLSTILVLSIVNKSQSSKCVFLEYVVLLYRRFLSVK